MILDRDRQPFHGRIERGPLRKGPREKYSIPLKAEVVVEACRSGLGPKPETTSLDSSFIGWRKSHESVSKDVYEGVQGRRRPAA